ncbi:2-C-methyl-D-erythritol 2,4-cyclodiphosphate synthase [Azohydromonas sediminis]|uniref:2-C-methyl-D-erythritol 2,4-cyclodiphosphate synthase n=1 Tax=Azohydromonas sediminis TaxID=2259674 RepID=UPI000E6579E7|nr:2-C-methyl-D-erythritol 2,4-cyclodiphosphate synthase [Azohydromonas sediminis]
MTTPHPPAPRLFALVPCAGSGSRAGTEGPKQYRPIAGRAMVAHTLAALAAVPRLAATLVVLAPDDAQFEAAVPGFAGDRGWVARVGGATRAASVAAGLVELARRGAADDDWVLVHDAARCLLRPEWVDALIDACLGHDVGGLLAQPVSDTLKQADDTRHVAATVDRAGKWAAQTPQMFRLGLLRRALAAAGGAVTDEASAVEALGLAPRLVAAPLENFKVTWPADFALAERLLASRGSTTGTHTMMTMRIGEGWDTHALVTGRPLILGGVTIPHTHGLAGHSDADALAHAITDALLGAAALGDIGRHFPDTDPQFQGADSLVLLAEAARRVRAAGWTIGNVDATIVAQAPKMAPHIPAMRERLAAAMGVAADQVNVKAKTAEKMGPVGEGRAIEARAVSLLLRT